MPGRDFFIIWLSSEPGRAVTRGMSGFCLVPDGLHAKLAPVQSAVNAQFDWQRDFVRAGFVRPTRARVLINVKESLLKPRLFISLPIFIIVIAE